MRGRLWALYVAALAVLLILFLALGWRPGSGHETHPAQPFAASTSVSPTAVSFGDRLGARLDVVVDPRAVDIGSVEVRPRFGLNRVAGATLKQTHGAGELLSYRYVLECLLPGCAPQSARVARRFPPALVSYRLRDGQLINQQVRWPAYQLISRVTEAEKQHPLSSLRFDASVPAPSYRIAPNTLRALAVGLAGLLALAAVVLAWIALRPHTAADRGQSGSRLEQALRAVRASTANGHHQERRKALGWLGRELRAVERPREADVARRLAWSEEPPTPRSAGEFATEVESADGAE
jgi:hypothetical protein